MTAPYIKAGVRRSLLSGGQRDREVKVKMNKAEVEALNTNATRRNCLSQSDYIRVLIEADAFGRLMLVDDAFATFCEALGRGFGGAAAELTAQADAYRLQKDLGKY